MLVSDFVILLWRKSLKVCLMISSKNMLLSMMVTLMICLLFVMCLFLSGFEIVRFRCLCLVVCDYNLFGIMDVVCKARSQVQVILCLF